MKLISNLQNPTDFSKISKASQVLRVNPMMDDGNISTQINNIPLPPDHAIVMGLGGEWESVSQSLTGTSSGMVKLPPPGSRAESEASRGMSRLFLGASTPVTNRFTHAIYE
jgi:hypothetical protein